MYKIVLSPAGIATLKIWVFDLMQLPLKLFMAYVIIMTRKWFCYLCGYCTIENVFDLCSYYGKEVVPLFMWLMYHSNCILLLQDLYQSICSVLSSADVVPVIFVCVCSPGVMPGIWGVLLLPSR